MRKSPPILPILVAMTLGAFGGAVAVIVTNLNIGLALIYVPAITVLSVHAVDRWLD